ncbi:MAG: SDR family oxidoreductase [Actinomycetota bacterium]|nr:SDR family oxidoreductase [Actinomycetota bacterium]
MTDGSRVVVITGGAGGMGRAIAERFAGAGSTVVLADLTPSALDDAVRDVTGVDTIAADVTSVDDCERIVATTLERHGRIDVLVTAAGVWVEGPSVEMTEAQWDRTIDVNLKGTFFACRSAIPALVASRGCIVAISSDYGLVGGPGAAIYCASKFGVNGLVRSLALELAPQGVRANSVCPADVDTPMLAGQARDFGNGDEAGYLANLLATLPQGERARFIRPDEVASLVAFLASDEATPITGLCVPIEWGVTAGY